MRPSRLSPWRGRRRWMPVRVYAVQPPMKPKPRRPRPPPEPVMPMFPPPDSIRSSRHLPEDEDDVPWFLSYGFWGLVVGVVAVVAALVFGKGHRP